MKDSSFLNYIPSGKENAISAAQLAVRLGVDLRSVREMVHGARRSGCLILSGNAGYWRSDSLPELKEFYKRMRNMSVETLAAAEAARATISEIEGVEYGR